MAAVVGIVASLVAPVIELGKLIGPPIKRQFNYLCCFTSNIQSLEDEAKKLEHARDVLKSRVDEAERNAEVIFLGVKTWLSDANQIHVSFSEIEIDIPKVRNGFLKTKSRFSLSRKAKKMSEAMKKLQCAGKFDHISQPAPPLAMGSIPIGQVYEFETRKQIEEDIMEALRGGEVNMLGLCGMGGVGKTTMAKRIMNRVREENLFDEILMAVVSQSVDMLKIQREISESLGLNLTMESLSNRAHQLRTRLTGTKRILLVLDDVWERLEMEDLGIPCESGVKGCTVLLTSRDRDVFKAMDIRKVCVLQILPEMEAWFLFKKKVGCCLDDPDLVSIAEEVAKECNGLPLALVTVGMALKDQKNKSIWEHALEQLKSSYPVDMPDVVPKVYKPLRLSYDYLVKIMPNAKFVFLLCSLFPEDSNISLKELTCYIMGLGIFKGSRNLEKAKTRVCLLVELLKSRFLLLDGKDEHYVKMHDVIRNVAIFIASGDKIIDTEFDWSIEHAYSNCEWISKFSRERIELSMVLNVPNLRLLYLWGEIQIHDRFFEVMKELNVLSIRSPLNSLPQTMQLLKNLQTLILDFCRIESVSIVGELLSLEILSCRSCDMIVELPAEIGRLTRLRSLDFSFCSGLARVAPGVISSLVCLEELKMKDSFKEWESNKNGKERRNASLNELQSLSNLTCLEIEIGDCTLATEEMRLSSKIVKYYINLRIFGFPIYSVEPFEKRICMRWPEEIISLGDWILILLRNNEYLELGGDGSNNLDLAQVQNMKRFHFRGCSTVKKLVSTTSIDWRLGVFLVLESLTLEDLPNLEEICDGPVQAESNSFKSLRELALFELPALMYLWDSRNQKVSLSNLSSIVIKSCDKLRNLFPLQMAKDTLLQLKRLIIESCPLMEEVFSKENKNDGEVQITFPKLESLSLRHLPSLTVLCKGIESIEWPLLRYMDIIKCPKLTSFVCSTGNNVISLAGHSDDSFHLFCNQKVTFGSLKNLRITEYENIRNLWCGQIPPVGFFSKLEEIKIVRCGIIRSLFSSSTAANLVNLKQLHISYCNEMVKVIGDEENVSHNFHIFPSLQIMALYSLPNLVNFCGWRCGLHLPSLSRIEIVTCPRMENFTMGSSTTPNLKFIQMSYKFFNKKDVEDLNGVVQLCFREKDQCDQESAQLQKAQREKEQEESDFLQI